MRLDEEHRDWLTLALVPGVGTSSFVRLLARFHNPRAVLDAPESALKEVVHAGLAGRIKQYLQVVDVAAHERLMEQYDVALITLDDPHYPVRLAEIYDPPLVLFARGAIHEADESCLAIVGTRHPSPYGVRMAEKFAGELASRGITIVSGMAEGIDSAAHRGALEAGGRTIAVLGNGVDVVFPAQNAALMDQIIRQGCVISEFEMGMKPMPGNFPHRNRVISGMALGTLIVEAPAKSGALITAKLAAEQGREVFAVPGHVGARNSEGPHRLIREGAKLVETVEDILVELDVPAHLRYADVPKATPIGETSVPEREPSPASPSRSLPPAPTARQSPPSKTALHPPTISPVEKDVLSVLASDGSFVDEIAQACRISVSEALSSLTLLELKGLVRQFSGKRFAPR